MRPKIYLFGDSITEESFGDGGWGASLTNHFSRQVDVVLRGYSGYNTRWALMVAERVFPQEESGEGDGSAAPLAVTVFFGANDACLPDRYAAFQHVPLHEYKHNLHSIVSFFKVLTRAQINIKTVYLHQKYSAIRENSFEMGTLLRSFYVESQARWPKTIILLITPPPIDEDTRLRHPYMENPMGLPERTNDAAGAYAKACIAAAKECGCPVVDLWTKMQEFTDWKNALLRDGLHLTPDGNRIVFQAVVTKLQEHGVSLQTLPVDLPEITEIDPHHPLKAFQN